HRARRLALLGRLDVALRALQPTPRPRRRLADRKAGRRLSRRHAAFERRHNTLAQIQAVRLTHRSIPPAFAVESNHSSLSLGIPPDSLFRKNALGLDDPASPARLANSTR